MSEAPSSLYEATPGKPLPHAGRNTVLVLEDNETLAGLVTVILTQIGLKVVWTRFGRDGLDKFNQLIDEVVLVLADCHLPDMHGADVCKQVRVLAPNVPVLLTSGRVSPETLAALPISSPTKFLPKPYSPAEMQAKVQAMLSLASGAASAA
jgi:two-component system cell cycle response regulator CtrA